MSTIPTGQEKRRRRERRMVAVALGICAVLMVVVLGASVGPAQYAYWSYAPQEGDILFQSLPHSPLVNAIEGGSQSPYSHCGIVAKSEGDWVVYEAYRNVEVTPLREFLARGREGGFAVYRLKPAHQPCVPALLEQVRSYLGRPYDVRYRMDDEAIYCSELIYKAYASAAEGEQLGNLDRLGDLNWRPYRATIEYFEGGPVPLEREMITPKQMAAAEQLELVFAYGIETSSR